MRRENIYVSRHHVILGSEDTWLRQQPDHPLPPNTETRGRLKVSEFSVPCLLSGATLYQALVPSEVPVDGVFSPLRPLVEFLHSVADTRCGGAILTYNHPAMRKIFDLHSDGHSSFKSNILKRLVSLEEHLYRTAFLIFKKLDEQLPHDSWTPAHTFPYRNLNSDRGVPIDHTGHFASFPYATHYRHTIPNQSARSRAVQVHRMVHGFRLISALVTFAIALWKERAGSTSWVEEFLSADFRPHWISELANDPSVSIQSVGRVGGFIDLNDRDAHAILGLFDRLGIPFWYRWHSDYSDVPQFEPYAPVRDYYLNMRAYIDAENDREMQRLYADFQRSLYLRQRQIIEADKSARETQLAKGLPVRNNRWVPGESLQEFVERASADINLKKQTATKSDLNMWTQRERAIQSMGEISYNIKRYRFSQWCLQSGVWVRTTLTIPQARDIFDRNVYRFCNPITQEVEFTLDDPKGIERKTTEQSYEDEEDEEDEDFYGPIHFTATSPIQTSPTSPIQLSPTSPIQTSPTSPIQTSPTSPIQLSPTSPNEPCPASPLDFQQFDLDPSPTFEQPVVTQTLEDDPDDNVFQKQLLLRFGLDSQHQLQLTSTLDDSRRHWLMKTLGFRTESPRMLIFQSAFQRIMDLQSPHAEAQSIELHRFCDLFDATDGFEASAMRQRMLDGRFEVRRFLGCDGETWYTFHPNNALQRASYGWMLAVRSSTALLTCLRWAEGQGEDFSIDHLATYLLQQGMGFKTLVAMPAGCQLIPTCASLAKASEATHRHTNQYRAANWRPSSEEYALYRNMLRSELMAESDRIGRAALLNGGISWRIALDVYEANCDFVLRGPQVSSINYARYDIGGMLFYDDELDVRAQSIICGQISIPVHEDRNPSAKPPMKKRKVPLANGQKKYRLHRFWPAAGQWSNSRWVGYWTPVLEELYTSRVNEYIQGSIDALHDGTEWAKTCPPRNTTWMQSVKYVETHCDKLISSVFP